ncbi:hypothetical protein [Sorangium sp. So ce388]|uniref:hypothetical protein n=1 Tax=Sorangium sp. So ce388 TaxID=3133309 RepID=UPI003F5B44BE
MSGGRGDGGLAEDLLKHADRRDPGATVPWVAIGEIVQQAEALRERGELSAETFAGLRRRALGLMTGLPSRRRAEALMSLDAMAPRRAPAGG